MPEFVDPDTGGAGVDTFARAPLVPADDAPAEPADADPVGGDDLLAGADLVGLAVAFVDADA